MSNKPNFHYPGVQLPEIDQTFPVATSPQGVPAGVIGTAPKGPAFVPRQFATTGDFQKVFGTIDGNHFGPLAVKEWLLNASNGLFIRVLGAGTGEKKLASAGSDSDGNTIEAGGVKNAGYTVGQRLPKANGYLGNNPYAYSSNLGAPEGRTYFLSTFMSESAGSNYFSDSGIQEVGVKAIPILRAVIMTPSGVVASLAGSQHVNNTPAASAATTTRTAASAGGVFGSANVSPTGDGQFYLILNGHVDTVANPNVITSSLDMGTWLRGLNTDPLKIQEAGHYVYASYPISNKLAVVTCSLPTTTFHAAITGSGKNIQEPAVFLMTGSQARNTGTATIPNFEGFQDRFKSSFSPWIISQKFGSSYKNLFRVHSLSDGTSGLYKIQVSGIEAGPRGTYGKFNLTISEQDGTSPATYSNLSLDPSSPQYIAKVIGNTNTYYDFDQNAGNQRLVVEGTFPNASNRIRVEMHSDVTNRNIDKSTLPMGFRGLYHLITSGSDIFDDSVQGLPWPGTHYTGSNWFTNAVNQPPVPLRTTLRPGNGKTDVASTADVTWGFVFNKIQSNTSPNSLAGTNQPHRASFLKYFPYFQTSNQAPWCGNNQGTADSSGTIYDADRFNNNLFTLERVQILTSSAEDVVRSEAKYWNRAAYRRNGTLSGSLQEDESGKNQEGRFLDPNKDFANASDYTAFTIPMQSGFDGVNIFNKSKSAINNSAIVNEMLDASQGQKNGPSVKSYFKALDVISEKSDVDIKILAIPGIRAAKVTDQAISKVETRFDAIYIMDIEEKDTMNNIVTGSLIDNPLSVNNTMQNMKNRSLDSSFAAAYWPDINIEPVAGSSAVSAPPSVAALGAFALNDFLAHPWFAPAGFTRGVLTSTESTAMPGLTKNNISKIYESNVNPIVHFGTKAYGKGSPTSAGGPIIYGQKTLQSIASSLDRVNVRRLLIDIRRKVRNVARTFIFEPNRASTLSKFSSQVEPILANIQQKQGVERYKVVIDASTTTQADIENNTVRGKIFLQPTRSIEFISVDFVVSNNIT
ncbi:hypothetical protein CL634_09205 [bacterium]|nr:hypothetical protein [bacterium]